MMPFVSGSKGERMHGYCKIYAGGSWIAGGDYSLFPDLESGNYGAESGQTPFIGSLRITDGERDIAVSPSMVVALVLEFEDGRWCAFAPTAGSAAGSYYQIRTLGKLNPPPLLHD